MKIFDWKGIKAFWASREVKRTLYVMLGLLLLMATIVLIGVFVDVFTN